MSTSTNKATDAGNKIKVVKSFSQNGFEVTVCEYDLSDRDRILANLQMKKQLLEYMALTA